MSALGIDIGGSSVKVALLGLGEPQTARSRRYTDPSRNDLVLAVRNALEQLPLHQDEPVTVGLCLPGKHSTDGDCIERSVNLPCLEDWVFDALVETVLGIVPTKLRVCTDIHAAAHDLCVGKALGGRVAVIAIGTGVGLAVLDDAEPIGIGARGIGHLGLIDVGRLGETDRVAPDGAINTLECYVGARGLRSMLGELDDEQLVAHLQQVALDDPFFLALIRALRIVHGIYGPETIVLAGGIGNAISARRTEIHAAVSSGLTTLVDPCWDLLHAHSLYHAACGAARLALG